MCILTVFYSLQVFTYIIKNRCFILPVSYTGCPMDDMTYAKCIIINSSTKEGIKELLNKSSVKAEDIRLQVL